MGCVFSRPVRLEFQLDPRQAEHRGAGAYHRAVPLIKHDAPLFDVETAHELEIISLLPRYQSRLRRRNNPYPRLPPPNILHNNTKPQYTMNIRCHGKEERVSEADVAPLLPPGDPVPLPGTTATDSVGTEPLQVPIQESGGDQASNSDGFMSGSPASASAGSNFSTT